MRALLILAGVLCLWLVATASAEASSLAFVKDGNVWLANPDGTGQYKVTLDGSTANPYTSPSQANDGTILAERGAGAGAAASLYRLAQNGAQLAPAFATGAPGSGPLEPIMSWDGTKVAFYFTGLVNGCAPFICPDTGTATAISYADHQTDPSVFKSSQGGWLYDYKYATWMTGSRLLLPLGNTVQYFDLASQQYVDWFHFYDYPDLSPDGTGGFIEGAVSPDGQRVALIAEPPSGPARISLFQTGGDLRAGNPPAKPTEIGCYVPPPDGTDGYLNGGEATLFDSLTWAPDGSAVAFGYANDIYVVTLNSRTDCTANPITRVIKGASDPSWGPANVNPAPRPVPPAQKPVLPSPTPQPNPPCGAASAASGCSPSPASSRCVVPSVLGRKLPSAKKAITWGGCKPGKVTRRHASRPKHGRVLAQTPQAGASRPAGFPVNLVVAR